MLDPISFRFGNLHEKRYALGKTLRPLDGPEAFYISIDVSLKISDSKRNIFTALFLRSSQYALRSMMTDALEFNLD